MVRIRGAEHGVTSPRQQLMGVVVGTVSCFIMSVAVYGDPASIAEVHVWPEAAVIADSIVVADVCSVTGLSAADRDSLLRRNICDAPPPGGSRIVGIDQIQAAVRQAGINPATTILRGSSSCTVRRPQMDASQASAMPSNLPGGKSSTTRSWAPSSAGDRTLRDAVEQYLQTELSAYGGEVEIDLDHANQSVLNLSEPDFSFDLHRLDGRMLGMVRVEVRILAEAGEVHRVELQPIVRFHKNVVLARGAINRKAEIRPTDLQMMRVQFDSLDQVGISDPVEIIGQLARRYIAPGTPIQAGDIESVPLVRRGQLVQVHSRVGEVAVVTAAKAMESGRLGDTIELRAAERRDRRMHGVVTGPGQVSLQLNAEIDLLDENRAYASRPNG